MQNLHIIKIKYLGPTDNRGARVKLTSERFFGSVTLDYDYSTEPTEQAVNWLKSHGFKIVGTAEGRNCDYVITSTFKNLK